MSFSTFNTFKSIMKSSIQVYVGPSTITLPSSSYIFTSDTLTKNGITLTLSCSSHADTTDYAYNAFNSISSTFWSSAFNGVSSYTSNPYNGGSYVGGGNASRTYSVVIQGTTYSGEWLQIQYSVPMMITTYNFINRGGGSDGRTPYTFVLVGSNDLITWFLLDSQTSSRLFTDYTPCAYTINTTTNPSALSKYIYIRFIVRAIYSSSGPCNLQPFGLTAFK